MNSRKYNVFVSVNAIASGRRSRTRDAIGAVRHVFLDADHDGSAVLSRVAARHDLPSPSYVLHSSPNRVHVFWRVRDFDCDSVERLQKHLVRELQTDPAATPVTQNTRLPGFFNHKRAQPHLVTIDYRDVNVCYGPEDFPQSRKRTPGLNRLVRTNRETSICLRLNERSATWRRCRRQLQVSMATSTRSVFAVGSREDLHSTTSRRCTCWPNGTRGASPHGHKPNWSTNSAARLGMGVNQSEDCCSEPSRSLERPPPAHLRHEPTGQTACQVSLNSRVHRSTSTALSVTTHEP